MLLLRKIVFYLFLFIYLIFCPLVILYALGYIFKPDTEKHIVETGVIYLATKPSGASVYMNKKSTENVTPTAIEKLVPGEYSINLILTGFHPWSDTLPVKAEKATVADKIILIPKVWKKDVLLPAKFKTIIPLNGTNFFIAAKGDSLKEHILYDYKNSKSYALPKHGSPYKEDIVKEVYTVSESYFFIVKAIHEGKQLFLLVDFTGQDVLIRNITDLIPEEPIFFRWSGSDRTNIFSLQKGYVNKIDAKNEAVYPRYIENAIGFGMDDKLLYVLDKDFRFYTTDYNKKGINELLDDKKIGKSVFRKDGSYKIIPFVQNIVLFVGNQGELIANRLPYIFVKSGVHKVKLDQDRKRILYVTKNSLGILDFSVETTGNIAFEKGPDSTIIYDGGKDISQAYWMYEYSHVIFMDSLLVSMLGLEEYRTPRFNELFDIQKKSAFYYSEDTGCLYYVDKETSNIVSSRLLPEENVQEEPVTQEKK